MPLQAWKIIAALIMASPFIVFIFLFVTSPAAAGAFAGSLLARVTDPPVLTGIILSALAGFLGYRWPWALGIGVVVALVGSAMGYSWWEKVAGSEVATRTATSFAVWAIMLSVYGFVAGQLFHRRKS